MYNNLYASVVSLMIGMLWLCTSCQKSEFMPDPVGEEIPAPNHAAFLASLPERASLFKAMWQRAEMDELIKNEQAQAKLTFFVPTNNAMEAAGYDASAIAATDKLALQKALRYHVLNSAIQSEQLAALNGDLAFFTLLTHPTYLEGINLRSSEVRTVPYQYQHRLAKNDGELLVDGKKLIVEQELTVAEGTAFLVDRFLVVPEQQMYDYLVQDGRFSLYLKSMDISNVEYANDFNMNLFVYYPVPIRLMIDWNYHFDGAFLTSDDYPRHVIRGTLFAPTDDAFHQLGIYTEDDLKQLNARGNRYDYYNFGQNESTPVDSLLRYHFTGRAYTEFGFNPDFTEFTYVVQWYRVDGGNSAFFSQMLDDRMLSVFPAVEHRFDRSGEQIKVGHLHAKQQALIIQENVNTIQGPVHVVDKIIVPEDFSMWHKK